MSKGVLEDLGSVFLLFAGSLASGEALWLAKQLTRNRQLFVDACVGLYGRM